MEDESGLSSDPEELAVEIEKCESKVTKLQEKIAFEDAKMDKYRVRASCIIIIILICCLAIFLKICHYVVHVFV